MTPLPDKRYKTGEIGIISRQTGEGVNLARMGAGQSQDYAPGQEQQGTSKNIPQKSDSLPQKSNNLPQSSNNLPQKNNNLPQSSNTDAKPYQIQHITQVSLPHNCEEILKHADSPVDRISKEKLCEQLYAGVYLNQKKKKYWVEKGSKRNCFTLFARDLLITWADDERFWHWPLLTESSEESLTAAELINVCWLEVHGRFEMANLTPETVYQVVFIVKLKDPAYGWEVPVNLRLTLPDGNKQERKETLIEKPRERWIEIPAGEFKTSSDKGGELEISLYEYEGGKWKKGLLIKGVSIRPKAS